MSVSFQIWIIPKNLFLYSKINIWKFFSSLIQFFARVFVFWQFYFYLLQGWFV